MIWVSLFFRAQSADLPEILEEINDLGQHVFQAHSADLLEIIQEIKDLGHFFFKFHHRTYWKYSRKSMIWVSSFFRAQSADLLEILRRINDMVQLVF